MEMKSVKKMYKDKKIAAGCSRGVTERGAAMLGRDFDTRIGQTILAMQSSKAVGERGNVCKFLLRRKRALEKMPNFMKLTKF